MVDIIIPKLPGYVNQFAHESYAPNPSLMKCGPAAGASCVDFAYPGRYDLYKLAHDEYVKLVGPDTASDKNGVGGDDMQRFFETFHVGVLDLMPLCQHGLDTGDYGPLHDEMEAENKQGVIQFLSVQDEERLINAKNGQSLHPGLHYGHCIVRLGFSDDGGYGLWFDPANPLACTDPVTHKNIPVEIDWAESIVKARPNFCFAIMPPGVAAPPAEFRYTAGTWPKIKPVVDLDKILSNLAAIGSVGQQLATISADLARDVANLKQEV